jgi:Tropinone reductase 1
MSNKKWTLEGKTAVITGGTKGIGKAIADRLLSEDCKVLTVSRTQSELETSDRYENLIYDLSDPVKIPDLVNEVGKRWGHLDVLVNNVGTNIRKKIEDYSEEEIDHIFRTNLWSALRISSSLIPLLKKSDYPSILNVSSVAGLGHLKTGIIYGTTKAGMNQMTKNMAVELAGYNIRVNAIAPWYIETALAMQVLQNPEYRKEVLDRTPMKRTGMPSEVAGVAAFLASPDASYITGQVIAVDGGFSINMF